jgi:hypothetical protein
MDPPNGGSYDQVGHLTRVSWGTQVNRQTGRRFRARGAMIPQAPDDNAPSAKAEDALLDDRLPRGLGGIGNTFAIAAAMSSVGALWISLQPTVTHSPLDGAMAGSILRWIFYLPLTLLGIWLVAALLDRVGAPGPGPVVTALGLAAPAIVAGTLAEILLRLGLGHGEVLAFDGVLERILQLIRVDIPIGAIAAILLVRAAARRRAALDGTQPVGR